MSMTQLAIHAPRTKTQSENKRSFDRTIETMIGDGYALTRREQEVINPGCKVIVLDKDDRRRAEGKLVKLETNGWTANGIQRFDVYMKDLKLVPYSPVRFTRRGVAII